MLEEDTRLIKTGTIALQSVTMSKCLVCDKRHQRAIMPTWQKLTKFAEKKTYPHTSRQQRNLSCCLAVIKYLNNSSLRERTQFQFIVLRVQPIMAVMSRQQELEAAVTLLPQSGSREYWPLVLGYLSPFYTFQDQAKRMILPTSWGFSSCLN